MNCEPRHLRCLRILGGAQLVHFKHRPGPTLLYTARLNVAGGPSRSGPRVVVPAFFCPTQDVDVFAARRTLCRRYQGEPIKFAELDGPFASVVQRAYRGLWPQENDR